MQNHPSPNPTEAAPPPDGVRQARQMRPRAGGLARWIGGLALILAAASAPTLAQANLIANPGFETGDLTGWTEGGNLGFTGVQPTAGYVHAGTYSAFTGGFLSPSTLSQDFIAPAGAALAISFWLSNETTEPPGIFYNAMTVSLNGVALLSLVESPNFDFTQFSLGATGSATGLNTLTFESQDDQAFFGLDDVSVVVTSVPEPASLALLGAGLVGLAAAGRRRRA